MTAPEDDLFRFLERRRVRVGKDGYTRLDRYRDFKVTFSTEAGQRVLRQVMDIVEGPPLMMADLSNHALLAARLWGQNSWRTIYQYATEPPPEDAPQPDGPRT